jgi:hypothetical protein
LTQVLHLVHGRIFRPARLSASTSAPASFAVLRAASSSFLVFLPSLGEPEIPRIFTFDISIRKGGGCRIKAFLE